MTIFNKFKMVLLTMLFIVSGIVNGYSLQGPPIGAGPGNGGGPSNPPTGYCQQNPSDPACNTAVPMNQGDWAMLIFGLMFAGYTITKLKKKGISYE
jgi:hypothetical protein